MAAAAITVPVPLYEYLHTVYEPDMDYVDGVLEDRNVGEFDHWRLQRALFEALSKGENQHGYYVVQETRTQVAPTRFRVPDTCLIARSDRPKRIIQKPPLLCIEVLSPEDRFSRTLAKCQDYLAMGVPEVWILDPETRLAHVLHRDGTMTEHSKGSLRLDGTQIEVSLDTVFGVLNEE